MPGASCLYLIHFWLLLSSSHGDTLRNSCQVLAGCWNSCTGPWWVSEERTSPRFGFHSVRVPQIWSVAVPEDPLCNWIIGTVILLPLHGSRKASWSLSTFRAVFFFFFFFKHTSSPGLWVQDPLIWYSNLDLHCAFRVESQIFCGVQRFSTAVSKVQKEIWVSRQVEGDVTLLRNHSVFLSKCFLAGRSVWGFLHFFAWWSAGWLHSRR